MCALGPLTGAIRVLLDQELSESGVLTPAVAHRIAVTMNDPAYPVIGVPAGREGPFLNCVGPFSVGPCSTEVGEFL